MNMLRDLEPILAEEGTIYLTTRGRRTGRPHSVGLWFVYHGGTIHVGHFGRGPPEWAKNILKDGRVSLEIRGYEIEGVARVVEELSLEAVSPYSKKYGLRYMDVQGMLESVELGRFMAIKVGLGSVRASESRAIREYISPACRAVSPGQPAVYTVNITGPRVGIKLGLGILSRRAPAGLTHSFDPPSGIPPFASVLVASTSPSAPIGSYSLAVGSAHFTLHIVSSPLDRPTIPNKPKIII